MQDAPVSPVRHMHRRARWAAHREQRREAMVQAAVNAIRRRGTDVTMDDIAAEAGVAKPILYRVFRDKAELYRSVGTAVAETMLVPALMAEMRSDRDSRQQAAAVIDAYLRVIETDPQLYRFVVHPALDDRPVSPELVRTYKQVIAEHLARLIGSRLRAGGLDSGAAEPWAHAVVGMVHEAGDWWLEHPTMSREELTAYLTDLVWGGFSAAEAAATPR
jgi:AcrR family transcriptional regulator